MSSNSKAVRVEEVTVSVVDRCPVCYLEITGTLEVAIHLGEVQIMTDPAVDNGFTLDARVPATPQLRSLRVRHDCKAPTTEEALERLATEHPDTPTLPPRVLKDVPQA